MEGSNEQPSNIVEQYGDTNSENTSMVVVGFDETGKAWVKHRNTFGDWTPAVMPDDVPSDNKDSVAQYFGTFHNFTSPESGTDQ